MTENWRTGDWMHTYTGMKFYPMEPNPSDICIEDIAHALSMQCRYNGHTLQFYSVAQHCVLMSRHIENYADSTVVNASQTIKIVTIAARTFVPSGTTIDVEAKWYASVPSVFVGGAVHFIASVIFTR